MENFFTRYRNEWILVAILFIQIIALATQVRVPDRTGTANPGYVSQSGSTRLIRVWAYALVSPFQRLTVNSGTGFRGLWHEYVDLRQVRRQNQELQREINNMRLEQARLQQDAEQGKRLQSLLGFREQYIAKTIAAQVIGTSGTELSRVIYIDRGTRDGVEPGMAVITPDGIVGKISRADRMTSQVLMINDPQSGAGILVERSRLNGILKGSSRGYPEVQNVMADENIQPGDRIITTGGDHVFPKGLAVGTVESATPDREHDPFLSIKVKPAVHLGQLEEVLVVTELAERAPQSAAMEAGSPTRAADVMAERLPNAPKLTEEEKKALAAKKPVVPNVSDRFSPKTNNENSAKNLEQPNENKKDIPR